MDLIYKIDPSCVDKMATFAHNATATWFDRTVGRVDCTVVPNALSNFVMGKYVNHITQRIMKEMY